jgi:hypothetical protein
MQHLDIDDKGNLFYELTEFWLSEKYYEEERLDLKYGKTSLGENFKWGFVLEKVPNGNESYPGDSRYVMEFFVFPKPRDLEEVVAWAEKHRKKCAELHSGQAFINDPEAVADKITKSIAIIDGEEFDAEQHQSVFEVANARNSKCLAEWLAEHGSTSQTERFKADVLPWGELEQLAKRHLFGSLDTRFARHRKLAYSLACNCVPADEESIPYVCDVTQDENSKQHPGKWGHRSSDVLTDSEFETLKKIKEQVAEESHEYEPEYRVIEHSVWAPCTNRTETRRGVRVVLRICSTHFSVEYRLRPDWLSFKEARTFARGLGLQKKIDWEVFASSPERPSDIPGGPDWVYQDQGWRGWKDFLYDVPQSTWETGCERLESFFKREGHASVSHNHVEDGFELWRWVAKQRSREDLYRSDPTFSERLKRLDALGFVWTRAIDEWKEGFRYLDKFVAREGHTLVPHDYRLNGFALGQWVAEQRHAMVRRKLSPDQMEMLRQISFDFNQSR